MKNFLIILLLCVFFGSAMAEPMKLTNSQADGLLATLLTLEAGLTATNTTVAADNINVLKPKVEAYSKGQQAAVKKFGVSAGMKNDDPAFLKYLAEAEANGAAEITVELTRFSLSDEEISAAKIKPSVLAVLRQYLLPIKK